MDEAPKAQENQVPNQEHTMQIDQSIELRPGMDETVRRRAEQAVYRAQVYAFLAAVYLYPIKNWSEDLPLVAAAAARVDGAPEWPALQPMELNALQAAYRRAFGATGSLCYETEYGLPHEFRQAQELADIAGFYRAFGFSVGNVVRERPDHLATELEFMHLLHWKEAHALLRGMTEQADQCVEARSSFIGAHLGTWVDLFAQSLLLNSQELPYSLLAWFTAALVQAEATALGIPLIRRSRQDVRPTPFDPDFSCAACPLVDLVH
uniref:Molecular chaperone TorD family protein n=2 Tax=Litorilinea aerophila TaxID=1204385 RepID=A0A540VKP4_9CHLR